ncbi:unnamed protein product [Arctia plantaginis]|uniref:Uncharacterized protein n=1 Tax=Arctia plantaginis TaxID=874455 RepID=A0A8S0ZWG6_ARCPL|nr:unnamed protein product [Arctia plantaginis]
MQLCLCTDRVWASQKLALRLARPYVWRRLPLECKLRCSLRVRGTRSRIHPLKPPKEARVENRPSPDGSGETNYVSCGDCLLQRACDRATQIAGCDACV